MVNLMLRTRKHSSRMHTDSGSSFYSWRGRVPPDTLPSVYPALCIPYPLDTLPFQIPYHPDLVPVIPYPLLWTDTRLWKHYLPLRSVTILFSWLCKISIINLLRHSLLGIDYSVHHPRDTVSVHLGEDELCVVIQENVSSFNGGDRTRTTLELSCWMRNRL